MPHNLIDQKSLESSTSNVSETASTQPTDSIALHSMGVAEHEFSVHYNPTGQNVLSKPDKQWKRRYVMCDVKSVSVSENSSTRVPSKNAFESTILVNGASGTLSGLSAYVIYFNFVGIKPIFQASTNRFVGIGNESVL